MSEIIRIEEIQVPFDGLAKFKRDAASEEYGFVETLVDEWKSGEMCFDKSGEKFLGASWKDHVIGLGGISVDQYLNEARVGRLKHIYVLKKFRRLGAARMLVTNLLEGASTHFEIIRLRVANEYASRLYEQFGFVPTVDPDASHILRLG